jgi:hypothetical protein
MHSLRIFWRSERLLTEHQLKLATSRLQFNAIAALSAVSGLVMLDIAIFFALSTYWGQALAALTIAGVDFVLAAALVLYASSIRAGTEIEMVKEVRDMALVDIEEEAALVEAELVELRDQAHRFMRNPVDSLLPGVVGPLLGTFANSLVTKKK